MLVIVLRFASSLRMRFFLLALLSVCLPLAALAEPMISRVAIESSGSGDIISIQASAPLVPTKTFRLSNPERLVVDLPPTGGLGVGLPKNYRGTLIQAIRFGRFDANTSRLVIDLRQPAELVETVPGNPLVLNLALGDDAAASPPAPTSLPAAQVAPASQPANAAVGKKPLVVIDAGHGGQDPGATGLHDTHEKIITLNYARALRDALLKTGRYRVQLTREDDRYILLPERVNIARRAKADLFISIHADSNPRPEAQGLSIYTLSETASDDEAAALAERENKSDIISGIDLNTTDPDVANILIDLTQRETLNKSSNLADSIVRSMQGKITTLEGTHRFAGFRVLKAPDVPSVLIELGFLTNPKDERLLLSTDYRDTVVQSIVKGIEHYRAGE